MDQKERRRVARGEARPFKPWTRGGTGSWMKRLGFAPSAPAPGTGIGIWRRGRPSKKLFFTVSS
jgi:hypothetical protein